LPNIFYPHLLEILIAHQLPTNKSHQKGAPPKKLPIKKTKTQ